MKTERNLVYEFEGQGDAVQTSLFPFTRWTSSLPQISEQYQSNGPVPHIYLGDFLDAEVTAQMAAEFPKPDSDAWTHYQHQNENKHGMTKRQFFPATVGEVTDVLNSMAFVEWLSALTGIPGLLADPDLEGGGLHQSSRGGYLNVHTDFSHHHYNRDWKRRVNLILYLNEGWQEQWGGAIELWDKQMRGCVASYPCHFNNCLIFNTDAHSYHGFPEALSCPDGWSRKSLALYYYTIDKDYKSSVRSTDYRARPGDGILKSTLIWLDKQAVNLYSRAKARLGFSDEFASKILGILSRKK